MSEWAKTERTLSCDEFKPHCSVGVWSLHSFALPSQNDVLLVGDEKVNCVIGLQDVDETTCNAFLRRNINGVIQIPPTDE